MLRIVIIFICISLLFANDTYANKKNIRVALAYAPQITTKLSDPYPTYIKSIIESANHKADITIAPLKRTLMFLETGRVDVQGPYIRNPNLPDTNLPFTLSTKSQGKLNFVLYTHKSKKFDLSNLSNLTIMTDRGWVGLLGIKAQSAIKIDAAMKMVNANRIDGVIYADVVTDLIIKKYHLNNIRRTLFGTFDIHLAIANTPRTQEIDKILTEGYIKQKESLLKRVLTSDESSYQDWQPFEEKLINR